MRADKGRLVQLDQVSENAMSKPCDKMLIFSGSRQRSGYTLRESLMEEKRDDSLSRKNALTLTDESIRKQ